MKYVEEVSISIHALLAESDPCAWYAPAGAHISIHALLAESDTDRMFCSRQRLNFYPRSPCGERPSAAAPIKLTRSISIHALLAESDFLEMRQWAQGIIISIHALLAESDAILGNPCAGCPAISIHALLAESDLLPTRKTPRNWHFYPRSPCGERLRGWTLNINGPIFLSTLSLRRATRALRQLQSALRHFYPRSPCGERRACLPACVVGAPISIHALLAESDFGCWMALNRLLRFLSTLSLRRATLSVETFR